MHLLNAKTNLLHLKPSLSLSRYNKNDTFHVFYGYPCVLCQCCYTQVFFLFNIKSVHHNCCSRALDFDVVVGFSLGHTYSFFLQNVKFSSDALDKDTICK